MAAELDVLGDEEWPRLYRARGDEVSPFRPILTGDVFEGVRVIGQTEDDPPKTVIIVDHPCAFRVGVDLLPKVLVYEVGKYKPIRAQEWRGYFKIMPLPDLYPDRDGDERHYAVLFTSPQIVFREGLTPERRVAALDPLGINLLQQRFLYQKTRVAVETFNIQKAYEPQYEEADLGEEWSEQRADADVPLVESAAEFDKWLSSDFAPGKRRRDALKDSQLRSRIRQDMKKELKAIRAA